VVHAVSTYHPFWSTGLDASVATYHVVVANSELVASVVVPGVDLGYRALLVGLHCRTMNHYQCYQPHDCTAIVPRTVVITVAIYRNTLAVFLQFTFIILYLFKNI